MADYVPDPSSAQEPVGAAIGASAGLGQGREASEGLNKASLSLESNSGCLKLTPMLSWNYFSLLSGSAYWYERNTGEAANTSFVLKKGNRFTVIEADISDATASANLVGESTRVTPAGAAFGADAGINHNQLLNQVFGIGKVRHYTVTYVDRQSSLADNHNGNIFTPTNLENAWKEVLGTEFASLSNTDTVPNCLIRTNLDFFKCGQDPITIEDPTQKYKQQNANLATEYGITSDFTLPENSSFAISFHTYFFNKTAGQLDDPEGKPYFRIYWANYCFQFNGEEASFCPNKSASDKSTWVFVPISGLKLTTQNSKELITLIFEVVGNHIVISNAIDVGDPDHRDKRCSWAYEDLENFDPQIFGITVPASQLYIGVRAMDIAFSYIPVVYPPKGKMIVSKSDTGYNTSGVAVSKVIDTHAVMGGQTQVTLQATGTELGYTITMSRENTPDKTPALHSIEITAASTYTGISIRSVNTINRVRRVDANLGLENQSGSIALDNRDGVLSDVGGILPCTISVGWAGDPSIPLTSIFEGFITNQGTMKNPNSSSADFQLVGRDLVLKDAIAINLPIYDGWDSGEAVNDLLARGGWQGDSDVTLGDYQLNVSAYPPSPVYKFPLGKPIMDCIRELATIAGYWAFVDNFGSFKYIRQSLAYGDNVGVYREVPNVNAYDEWQSLNGIKDSSDVRNAVLVVGLQMLTDELPLPIAAVRTDAGGTIGDYLADTLIPWLRWHIYQDPKINTVQAAEGIAEQLFQNNNRLRLSTSGMVWGHPKLLPWQKISIDLRTDNIGIPSGAEWRIISALHSLNADDRSNYTCSLNLEYQDSRYSFASYWE